MSGKKRLMWHFLLAATLLCARSAQAEDNDPPGRVARLAYLQGGVSFRPAGADDWVDPGLNRPLTIGDQLWSDRGGRIEIQLDGSNLRLGSETSAGILNLSDDTTQIQLSSGTLIVHVRDLADNESYEIDTPNVAFSILRPGTYRLSVAANGTSTAIAVRSGQGEVAGGNGTGYTVRAGEYDTFSGVDQIAADSAALGPEDEFDAWSAGRDGRFDHSQSAQYVSNDVVGYEELDNQGSWDDTPDYGHVWFPTGVEAGWAPYQRGHWAYVAPWGYTWIDDRPWGFAPFHYGRWIYWRQRWGWVPAPPPAPRAVYVRPVYAPALVAWVGSGATVAWFPLAPREVYVPSYPVSRRYLNVVNVSNTHVNTTIINNVYNTTIINRTTINNVTYANRHVPGAVMTTSSQDFASARPVRRDSGGDARVANAPVRAFAPSVLPTRAAVYGGRGPADLKPSQAVQTRVTAARMVPAAVPPPLDARPQALRDGGGHGPSVAQPAAAAATHTPQVRVVPPVRTLVSSRDFDRARPQTAPAITPPPGAARPPTQAGEIPAGPRVASPGGASSVLGRQQSQEQQQRLGAGQAADARRQQVDQQQAQSQASAELARRQQLDQQRQEQQRNAQLEQIQAQQRAQVQTQARAQQQAQAQAEQQRAAQQGQQRELEQQVQQQRNAQLQAQQRAQQEQQAQQARIQQQAQAQAEVQKNQQLERQRESAQQQYQRQQQTLDTQRQQQTQQLQQQQAHAREELQERQQAAQRQQDQQRHPNSPPPQNPRQPY